MTEPEVSSGEAYLRDLWWRMITFRINCPTCDYRYLPGRGEERGAAAC